MNQPHFVIIDYGMGNVRSVMNALEFLGYSASISSDPAVIGEAAALILPGVGAFGEAMQNLSSRRLVEPIQRAAAERRIPFLGICLGMQLVAERSDERGEHAGLGLIPGHVRQMSVGHLPLPHVGWNPLTVVRDEPFLRGITDGDSYYFVHTYCLDTEDAYVAARSDYGAEFVAAVQRDNIFATQFHPEKSQKKGLRILRNFAVYAQGRLAPGSPC